MLTRSSLTIRLHPNDDVVIARRSSSAARSCSTRRSRSRASFPRAQGRDARNQAGEPVRRYNQIIGFASRDIAPGEHVHLNNLAMGAFERDYAFGADMKPTQYASPQATFDGIVRPTGASPPATTSASCRR
jgi:altronate hydrolase